MTGASLVHKSINEILTSIKSHNSFENEQKYCSVIQIYILSISIYIYIYIKSDQNTQINSQDIEHKQSSDVEQGP